MYRVPRLREEKGGRRELEGTTALTAGAGWRERGAAAASRAMPLHLVAATHVLAGVYHVLTQVPYLLDRDVGTIGASGSRLQDTMERGLTTAFARNLFRSQVHLHLLVGILLICVGLSRRDGPRLPSSGSISTYSSSGISSESNLNVNLNSLPARPSIFQARTTGMQTIAAFAALLFWGKGVPTVWQEHPILPEWDVYRLDNPVSCTCMMFTMLYTLSIAVEVYQYCRRYVR